MTLKIKVCSIDYKKQSIFDFECGTLNVGLWTNWLGVQSKTTFLEMFVELLSTIVPLVVIPIHRGG